jgi:hypothetical protein
MGEAEMGAYDVEGFQYWTNKILERLGLHQKSYKPSYTPPPPPPPATSQSSVTAVEINNYVQLLLDYTKPVDNQTLDQIEQHFPQILSAIPSEEDKARALLKSRLLGLNPPFDQALGNTSAFHRLGLHDSLTRNAVLILSNKKEPTDFFDLYQRNTYADRLVVAKILIDGAFATYDRQIGGTKAKIDAAIKRISQIPPDLVVDQWSSEGESSLILDFLFLHSVWTTFDRLISDKITPAISRPCGFTTKSGGI